MVQQRRATLDAWTPFSFKSLVGTGEKPNGNLSPDWVGEDHRRRLNSYIIARAFLGNVAKFFMPELDESRREYGDAVLIRDQTLSALIGDDYSIVTEGAIDPIAMVKQLEELLNKKTQPSIDPSTSQPVPGTEDKREISPEDQAKLDETRKAQEFQDWLRAWAKKQRFNMKMVECERHSVSVGDGVYTLGYNPRTKRLRLRVFDPGFYFPELTDEDDDEFPDVVHFAWEIEEPGNRPGNAEKIKVRRITYEMVELDKPRRTQYGEVETHTCLMSDGIWEINSTPTIHTLSNVDAVWATYTEPGSDEEIEFYKVDLEIGFIPVVHVPNNVAGSDHFGTATIANVLQVLEDLSLNDTDLQASSATTGKPPLVLKGSMGKNTPSYKAGDVWEVDENGGLDILDTSRSLDALSKHNESLLSRLSVNTRLPAVALGRAKVEREIAGISLKITYGPMINLIREMRQVRDEKYDLLWSMVWRMSKQYGIEGTPAQWHPSHLRLGGFLPTDLEAVCTQVVQLVERSVLSLETAVLWLMEAGVPINDVADEVLRIQARDFKGANLLLDATGDQPGVYTYLGRDMPTFILPNPNAQDYNPGDPTVADPGGASDRGVQAQGPPAGPGGPPPGGGGPAPAPASGPGVGGRPPGPRPAGATWVEGYWQGRQ